MAGTRTDIAALGGTWNKTIEWYARAVAEMQKRAITDRTSWSYLGAIHGFDRAGWIQAGIITASTPLPSKAARDRIWDQCQHSSWYFLPWHRGYLAAFEAIVAKTVAGLGGPGDWALPYWNYLNASNPQARRIPQAFLDANLPDGTPNALSQAPRGGTQVLGPQSWLPRDITLAAMTQTRYTAATGTLALGGGESSFAHFGSQAGSLELNPHNLVHVMVGGVPPTAGFMSDPNLAGLDPLFWLHHCNIDRLWEAWQAQAGNTQETGAVWSSGPTPRQFEMPDASGGLAIFTPGQTLPGGTLAPTYDDLSTGTGTGSPAVAVAGQPPGSAMPASTPSASPPTSTLVGSNADAVTVGATPATTRVQLVPSATAMAAAVTEERLFLNLENVRGAAPSGVLNISISSPSADTLPAGSAPRHVETVALFGLAKASASDGAHGGNGLSLAIDITDFAKSLANATQAALEQLDVRIEQPGSATPLTVERVKVFKQPVR
jgi:tyrosinase